MAAGQEGAMAAPTRSRDAEQPVWIRTKFRNMDQSRHSSPSKTPMKSKSEGKPGSQTRESQSQSGRQNWNSCSSTVAQIGTRSTIPR